MKFEKKSRGNSKKAEEIRKERQRKFEMKGRENSKRKAEQS